MITEQENENHQIIRRYEKENVKRKSLDLDEARALLIALGMDAETVNSLSDEKLQFASGCESIYSSESFIRISSDNHSEYVDRETALAEAAVRNEQEKVRIANLMQGIETTENWEATNDYIWMGYTVLHNGGGNYAYLLGARWITTPLWRGWDSLGSCAMNSSVVNESRWAEFKYDILTIDNGIATTSTYKSEPKNFQNAINGNWYGSGFTFHLPSNVSNGNYYRLYSNISASYWYTGDVIYPTLESNFNTTGSYDHTYVALSFNPSLTISFTGVVPSIGINATISKETWFIDFQIHYIP